MATDDTIIIDITIDAPIEKVWQAWTDPGLVLKWYGSDPNGWGIYSCMHVVPGGRYMVTFSNSDGSEYTCLGAYQTVDKPTELAFSWEWLNEPGLVSQVAVQLVDRGGQTAMHFEHANVGFSPLHAYLEGWTLTFMKLNRLVSSI